MKRLCFQSFELLEMINVLSYRYGITIGIKNKDSKFKTYEAVRKNIKMKKEYIYTYIHS